MEGEPGTPALFKEAQATVIVMQGHGEILELKRDIRK